MLNLIYDSGWKEIIELYLPQFLDFFYPALHSLIDYNKSYTFLDKELSKIIPASETGRKTVDKLVQVFYKNGEEKWILLHIEIQSQGEKDFAKRIYAYNYRILDRYKKDVISMVILGDTDKKFRPNKFEIKYPGFKLSFEYTIVKLIDFIGKEKQLEKSKNPFGIITLSHLHNIISGKDYEKKYIFKVSVVKRLYTQGFNKTDILNLYRFIDWVITLPQELDEKCTQEIFEFEEGLKMPFITTAERIGLKKGKLDAAKNMVKKGFDFKTIKEITGLSQRELKKELSIARKPNTLNAIY